MGGFAGGDDETAGQMRQQEEDRQRRIQAGIEHINNLFGGQQHQPYANQAAYDTQQKAVTDLNMDALNRQFTRAERENRYGLARSGLLSGQADVDSEAELTRLKGEGEAKARLLGEQAGSDLRTADERARHNLISQLQSGLDVGSATQMAQAAMSQQADNAASMRSGAAMGDLFNDLKWAYLANPSRGGQNTGFGGGYPFWDRMSPRNRYAGQ